MAGPLSCLLENEYSASRTFIPDLTPDCLPVGLSACGYASLSKLGAHEDRTLSRPSSSSLAAFSAGLALKAWPASLDGSSPMVVMGWRKGMRPKLYWKTPRPWKTGRETPMIFCSRFWTQRSQVPDVFSTWLNRLFSPKEKTGTSAALQGHRRGSVEEPREARMERSPGRNPAARN